MNNRFFKVLLILLSFFLLTTTVDATTIAKKVDCPIFGDPNDDGEKYDPNSDKEPSTAYFLQEVFNFIRFLGPVLTIVLSIIEFVKAAAEQNADALAKALKKTGWRIGLVILLFFLPYIINITFSWFGWYGTCNIG